VRDTIANYKTEAAVGTLSAVSLGTTNAPAVVQQSILNAHIIDKIAGSNYYLTVGDSLAIIGSLGVIFVLSSALIKFIRSKI
jgi:hypothetical protein